MRLALSLALILTMIATPLSSQAGRVGGPGSAKSVVKPYATDLYKNKFVGDVSASITVMGDGSTDLDCFVYDSEGNLVDSDLRPDDTCVLLWMPAWTGYFTLKIKNMGGEENAYSVRTN